MTEAGPGSSRLARFARAALEVQSSARHFAASLPVRLALFAPLALAAHWGALGTAGLMNDNRDAQNLGLYEEVARRTVLCFHELPLWDPYYCGGLPALGTPSARFVSPTFLLTLLFGTIRADPLIAFVMTLVGLEGATRYARARGGGALGSFLVAPVFALSGMFARFPTFGWTHFFGFELLPWALYGARAAFAGSRRGVVVLGLSVAWMVGFGGTYAAPITALAVGFELLEALLRRARAPRRALAAFGMAALSLAFAAGASLVRLWPIAEMLSAAPRVLGGTDGHSFVSVWIKLFGDGPGSIAGADFLIGLAILPVFFLGLARRKAWPLVVAATVWLWLAHGYNATPVSIYAWLRRVPPFTMLRAPERFLVPFALVVAVVSAGVLRRLEARARRSPRALLAWAACATLVTVDVSWLVRNFDAYAERRAMVDTPPVVDRAFAQARGNRWLALYYPMMSRGSLACFDDYNVAQSTELRGDLEQEEYLTDPSAGTVERLEWSPDRLRLRVSASRAARVRINQNYHPGWRSSAGRVVRDRGLLAVDLPAGETDLVLRFAPRSALGGGAASLWALGVAAVVLARSRRRARKAASPDPPVTSARAWVGDALLFASPLLVGLASLALVRAPARPATELVTPSGEPMVTLAPPDGATPVQASWPEGITLVASKIVTSHASGAYPEETLATIELDWRVTNQPPDGLGVAVTVAGPPGMDIPIQYALLSHMLLFEDAPRGPVLRDVIDPIRVPAFGAPTRYGVHVALFRARRSGERLPAPADAPIDEGVPGAVFAGAFTAR